MNTQVADQRLVRRPPETDPQTGRACGWWAVPFCPFALKLGREELRIDAGAASMHRQALLPFVGDGMAGTANRPASGVSE